MNWERLEWASPLVLCAAGSRAPGPSARYLVVRAGRIAVCCAWRRTPTDNFPRWRSGSAPTLLDPSPVRFATPSPVLSGWPWNGLRSVSVCVHQTSTQRMCASKKNLIWTQSTHYLKAALLVFTFIAISLICSLTKQISNHF